jgi:CxxC motif-containing protein (DUF1111 family)
MKKQVLVVAVMALMMGTYLSCHKTLPSSAPEDELLDGPIEGLNGQQLAQHLAGDRAFTDDIFTPAKGLGPLFVATSCASCHAGEGKGTPFTTLIRFGQTDSTGNHFMDKGGPQLQNRAIPGYIPENIPASASFSKFTPPANTGLGFFEAVTDNDILAMSDPNDADGDGISGVPNWNFIPAYVTPAAGAITAGGKYIGRFGKKAAVYNLLQQTVNAYNQDMGITSVFETKDVYSGLEIDPEVSTQTVNDVVFYLQTLKVPAQRKPDHPDVVAGAAIFNQINCSGCHKPALKTGFSPLEGLSNKTFHPYTDLLLHDMGSALDDGYTEGNAKTSEWRTPPLWGLGLSENAQGGKYFLMHDGRAKSVQEAIMLHGGEALSSRNKFNALTQSDKQKLLTFLESL